MSIFLIIILAIIITAISSIKFRPDQHKNDIKLLSSNKSKNLTKFIEIYPGFELFAQLIGLLFTILVACLSAMAWGVWAGCFIALIIIALAQLLGARLQSLTDNFIIDQAGMIYKYFSWAGILNSLVVSKAADPVVDTVELVDIVKRSQIDCKTQIVIEKAIKSETLTIDKIMTKWSDITKISYRDKLTPKRIDELFQSKQRIFPIIRNDDNDVVGLVHWNEISTIGQTEKNILAIMHRNFTDCDTNATALDVLRAMAHEDTTVVVVRKNNRVVGLANLANLLHIPVDQAANQTKPVAKVTK